MPAARSSSASPRWLLDAVIGSIFLAIVSTLGDFIWAMWIARHRPLFGLIHGSLLCLCIGGYLGALGRTARRTAAGAIGGAVIGLSAAGGFYVLAPLLGYSAMFVLWVLLWILMAVLYGAIHTDPRRFARRIVRGFLASLGSGAAFYAISGIWLSPQPGGPNYVLHLGSWFAAFLPGFAFLLWADKR